MTTAYTSKLQLALPVTGELDGTWGTVVNNSVTSMVEEAIAGVASISSWTGASHTLTTANGATSEARCMILILSGAPGSAATVLTPSTSKVYLVTNNVSGGFAATVKVSGQTGVSVPNGTTMWLYCNGTDIVSSMVSSPLSGTPTAPTAAADTNTTQVATTAHVFAERANALTLTNKTINLTSNTLSGTTAQFNTALSDGDFATLAGTETLTNKTLTSPAINGGTLSSAVIGVTAAAGDNDTSLATTAFVQSEKEYLPALSQSLHVGAVAKAIVYDTSKDSDGGAWRKRCADKSWYTETLGGDRWIGQYATIALAWAAAGSTTGAVFQASATAGPITSGKYYAATSATTATEVFRGITREFPAVAGIMCELGRVLIYDLSNGAMWMSLVGDAAGLTTCPFLYTNAVTRTLSSIAALNGIIAVGTNTTGGVGLHTLDFNKDAAFLINTAAYSRHGARFSGRNASTTGYVNLVSAAAIVNSAINDVAITVLDNAPIDPATGLPVPTIAVATAGGVSVIKDDGTVVNSSSTAVTNKIAFVGNSLSMAINNSGQLAYVPTILGLGSSFAQSNYTTATFPANSAVSEAVSSLAPDPGGRTRFYGTASRLALLRENPATTAKGMVSYTTNAYNTGWMPGDIRGAWLADTVAETLTASGELVVNGDFAGSVTTGWSVVSGAGSLSGAGALLTVTNDGTGTVITLAGQSFATVIGKVYAASADFTKGTAATGALLVGTAAGGFTLAASSITATGKVTATFVATTTTTHISVGNNSTPAGVTSQFDNISVKLAEPDRSVKNNGLIVNGTLTKAVVASGANLVAYSGFSAANYLEQPYNANLDFGTGDFCVMDWVNWSSVGQSFLLDRGTVGAGRVALYVNSSSQLSFSVSATAANSTTAITMTTGLHFVAMLRLSGVLYFYVDGVLIYSVANTANVTNTSAKCVIGAAYDYSSPLLGTCALVRVSATAPSADQIAHIYRTELLLFQANAKCTIDGTSTAVTALTYDDTTDLLHVGTSWGRTSFKDLARVDSEATTTGALTSLSAQGGTILTGGTSGKVYVPAKYLRDELQRKAEAQKALGRIPVFFDFTATASQTAFVLPKGYTAKALYKQGTLMRETTTGVYWTRSTDGFSETCTLSVGATVSDWISVMAVRSN